MGQDKYLLSVTQQKVHCSKRYQRISTQAWSNSQDQLNKRGQFVSFARGWNQKNQSSFFRGPKTEQYDFDNSLPR